MSALKEIKDTVNLSDPFKMDQKSLRELQLEAVQERFLEKRQQIKILDRRATEAGIDAIGTLDDLVPLLFTHTNYKSYPETFVDKAQWGNMNVWLQTLTSNPVQGVELEGIKHADDWIQRLADSGHHLFASSGTSGKCSFLDQTSEDIALASKAYEQCFIGQWGEQLKGQRNQYQCYVFFPPSGVHRLCEHINQFYTNFVAAPNQLHYVSLEPLGARAGIRAGQLRRAIADGTALPEEIKAFEEENKLREAQMAGKVSTIMEHIYQNRDKPQCFGVMWPQAFNIMQAMRERGVKNGGMHPDSILMLGGGVKGVVLPDDYKEQIYEFFNLPATSYMNSYGMVEMTGVSPFRHHLDAYSLPPWIVPLILDKPAENLINPANGKGVVEGRMALFDLLTDARWGGLISGDKVAVDFTSADGFAGPLVKSVARYQDLEEGEDKLTCAGTIDSYVRGAVGL
jgi:hypothetical protein